VFVVTVVIPGLNELNLQSITNHLAYKQELIASDWPIETRETIFLESTTH